VNVQQMLRLPTIFNSEFRSPDILVLLMVRTEEWRRQTVFLMQVIHTKFNEKPFSDISACTEFRIHFSLNDTCSWHKHVVRLTAAAFVFVCYPQVYNCFGGLPRLPSNFLGVFPRGRAPKHISVRSGHIYQFACFAFQTTLLPF